MARPHASTHTDVLDRILDKGIVVDIWARVSIIGLKLLTVEARVVAASIDTFLHYTQAISQREMVTESGELSDIQKPEIEKPTRPPTYAQAPG